MASSTLAGMIVAVVILTVVKGRGAVLHRVGGSKQGWKLGINFTDWASHEKFYVGDWLYFGFDKHTLSVLQVNKTGYNDCIETSFIKNITRGGRDVFNLTEAKPYYFISGRGFCYQGVKLAIDHVRHAPLVPSPSTNDDASSSYRMVSDADALLTILALVTSVLLSFLVF